MNRLSLSRQVQIISLLTEGMSLRSIHRLTGVHRDTILRLSIRIGTACDRLHNATMRDLEVPFVQLDEQWVFIHTKRKHLHAQSPPDHGDAFVWLAFDPRSKVVLSYVVGKRTYDEARAILTDLRRRLLNRPQLSTDALRAYPEMIGQVFGQHDVDYGMVVKEANFEKQVVYGDPDLDEISTSLLERCNLTTRMQLRRHTRRTNAHSKLLANHRTAVALHFAFYHFCRVHMTLRVTPAMELGVTNHIWSVGELIERATASSGPAPAPTPPPPREPPRLRVIEGGKR